MAAATGAAAAVGCSAGASGAQREAAGTRNRDPAGRPGSSPQSGEGQASFPSARSGGTGEVAAFRSRPDLRPARATVTRDSDRIAPGVILLDSHSGVGQQGPMILDRHGELVWFRPLSDDPTPRLRAFNVRVQRYHGEPVLTWFEGKVINAHGEGSYVLADSRYREIRRIHARNGYIGDLHEFLLTEAGTALYTCYGTASADLRQVGGPRHGSYMFGVIQELDLATGRIVFQWRSDEHVGFAESYAPVPKTGPMPWDYFHINSLSVAGDGSLLVSARNTWTVYEVERPSGRIRWRLGGKRGDFTVGPGGHFAWQHHVTAHPGGIVSIFDNEAGDYRVGRQSRGLVLRVSQAERRATLVRQYLPPVHILSAALGSVQILGDGHVFMGWGRPYFTEYDAAGNMIFDGHLAGRSTVTYRAFRSPWTGRPAGRPAIAVATASGGTGGMTVYASWNGDTEVRRWRVLGGPDAGHLEQLGTAARAGFETSIQARRRARYVAAAGLDKSGRELGRSAVVAA